MLHQLKGKSPIRLNSFLSWSLYFLSTWCLLYPILVTPLVADDFLNPFSQYSNTKGGYWNSIVYGWDTAFNGASMRLSGNVVGAVLNNLWLDLAGNSIIGLSTFYAVQKYLVFILCGLSLSYFFGAILVSFGREISFLKRTFLCSFIFFATLQIHGLWSNDPVSSYPMSGFMVAAIGFGLLGWAANTSLNPSILRISTLAVSCILSVLYYEILVGVGLLSLPILFSSLSRKTFHKSGPKIFLYSIPAITTLLTITISRLHSSGQSETYGGTTVTFGSKILKTFSFGVVSSLPASAWRVTSQFLGEGVELKLISVLTIFILVIVGLWELPTTADFSRVSTSRRLPLFVVLIMSLIGFWFFAVGLQSLTEKVQNETGKLGYVYSYYAIGAASVAVLIALGIVVVSQKSFRLRVIVFSGFLLFVTIQGSVTWRVSEQMSKSLVPNRTLLAVFSNFDVLPKRCDALRIWSAGNWPVYYEDAMIRGLQEASFGFHHELFCPNFIVP
jgi:hypothetical protein